LGRELGPIKHNVAWAEIYLRIMWHFDPSIHFAAIDMSRKMGVLCPFLGELNPHFTQCRLGRGLPPYQMVSSSIKPFGHNRHWPKIGGCALWGELGPHVTMSPGPTSISLSSGILIHPAVWPQQSENRHGPKTGVGLCAPF